MKYFILILFGLFLFSCNQTKQFQESKEKELAAISSMIDNSDFVIRFNYPPGMTDDEYFQILEKNLSSMDESSLLLQKYDSLQSKVSWKVAENGLQAFLDKNKDNPLHFQFEQEISILLLSKYLNKEKKNSTELDERIVHYLQILGKYNNFQADVITESLIKLRDYPDKNKVRDIAISVQKVLEQKIGYLDDKISKYGNGENSVSAEEQLLLNLKVKMSKESDALNGFIKSM